MGSHSRLMSMSEVPNLFAFEVEAAEIIKDQEEGKKAKDSKEDKIKIKQEEGTVGKK